MSNLRPVTIRDVALDAGVSQQTVSRVLHDSGSVRAETQQQVLRSIQRLGYVVNRAARELRLRRADRLGIIAHQLGQVGPTAITMAALSELQTTGYSVEIKYVADDDSRAIAEALRYFEQNCVGILAMMQTGAAKDQVLAANLRVPVFIDAGLDRGSAENPGVEERIGRAAADHLKSLGHKTVLHLPGPSDSLSANFRWQSFRDACVRRGIRTFSAAHGEWSELSGARRLEAADIASATAIFAANDAIAVGALKVLNDRQLPIPARMALLGVDDTPSAQFATPPLSSVRHDLASQGLSAARMLLQELDGVVRGPTSVEVKVIERESTVGPLRGVA